ncbi:TerC family protein [Cesiribacter andamanensis]|uniref:Inner membrane protein alx n=1 Tax=Cesiribacter andamanensis AMV16 TaxID=1279009 RepID=M7NH16_9BACT|nr:TerC family protein [Cesiribacter andamanensis]EMR01125.1 Inner membrane protein alx [Cesiribacter andamanensis AMV16]
MELVIWASFIAFILGLLAIDLGVFHKNPQQISYKEAFYWTAVWVGLALLFGGAVYYIYDTNWLDINKRGLSGSAAMLNFYTGFLIEKSLSLDNIFVIALIFTYFKIAPRYQHEVLFWGIIGAMVFRGIMIVVGTAVLEAFHWTTYLFGALLIYSAIRMLSVDEEETDFSKNPLLRLVTKLYPIDWQYEGPKFFIQKEGVKTATVMFVTLVIVEFTDVFFAIDSIPAIFAVTTDPFLVFTSNVFAILGLRTLYFFLVNFMDRFSFIKYSLVFILGFVGIKLMLANHYQFPTLVSLGIIVSMLIAGMIASVIANRQTAGQVPTPLPEKVFSREEEEEEKERV